VTERTRAIVLSGAGPSFCAGGDLNYMRRAATYSEEQNFEDAFRLAWLFQAMLECPAVIIAKVHGAAFGGGCGLVAAADVAIACNDTQFAFSEVRLGLVPATISPIVLAKIGAGHARALFSTGETFDANRALTIGLIHEMVLFSELATVVDRKLRSVLSAGPKAVALCKNLAQKPPMGLEDSARLLAKVRASEEGKEGVAAFLEKRFPWFMDPR